MSEWKIVTVDEFADVISGATPATNIPEYWDGDIEWVTPVDLSRTNSRYLYSTIRKLSNKGLENSSVSLLPTNSVVMSSRAPIGYFAITTKEFTTNQGCKSFTMKKNQDAEYHYYNFLFNVDLFKRFGSGSTFMEISKSDIEKLVFTIPTSLAKQRKIARILSTLDAVIEKTEAAIAKYQAIKAGMMQDLLTRGIESATGKLRPSHEDAPELYKKSELGWVPKEWEVVRLDAACAKIQDGTHFSPQSTTGSFMYLTSKNVRFGYLDISNVGWISEQEQIGIYKRCNVKYGDILLTKDGANTGNVAFNSITEEYSLLSSVAFLRCDEIIFHNYFLFHILLSPSMQQAISDLMSGNAITRLTLSKIDAILVVKPSYPEQCLIAKNKNTIHELVEQEKIVLWKNNHLKQALMSDFLTGKVRVKYNE
jgi:type I restriction enzyme S subunit